MLARKALAGTAGAPKEYVEDVFSSYLYTGSGATKTITNDIDLSGEGGMVWIKARSTTYDHCLYDTERGALNTLTSNTTGASVSESGSLTAFNADGFTLGSFSQVNHSSSPTYVSWTFRKAKKFFDVVTYTGNGTTGRTVSHNLGSTPGCIIVKSTSLTENWAVYHRSNGNTKYMYLNTTAAAGTSSNFWNNTDPTSTTFTLGNDATVNDNGATYVAYLFAHDAGGFGDAGSDSIIKCGSFDASSGAQDIDLGWEPQCVFLREATNGGKWEMIDNMRGFLVGGADTRLAGNSNIAESTLDIIDPIPNGFRYIGQLGGTVVYVAIRRGPMKTPETGTSVFTPTAFSGNDTSGTRSAGLNAFDLLIAKRTASSALDWVWLDKLRGLAGNKWLASNATTAEGGGDTISTINGQYTQDGINITKTSNYSYLDASGSNYVWYALKRAPKFFDEVCFSGNSTGRTIGHNLGVTPELIILKARNEAFNWAVYNSAVGATKWMQLDTTNAPSTASTIWNDTAPTSSVFSVGTSGTVNGTGYNYVAYLFATLAGVSKVGSYTGNGGSQDINCGFTNGARFIIIRNVDDADNWRVYDTARGIVSGNDPYLKLESTAVEVTSTDNVDPYSSGFNVSGGTNTNGKTFIYLAIA